MMKNQLKSIFHFIFIVLFFTQLLIMTNVIADEKKVIEKLDDLPKHTYEIQSTVSELIMSEKLFRPFAKRVGDDIESILEEYEIKDNTTLRSLQSILYAIDLLENQYESALNRIKILRELEEKPAEKLMTGLRTEAMIKAFQKSEAGDTTSYKHTFKELYSEAINQLPWDIVQDQVESQKGSMEIISENLYMGIIESRIEPIVEKTGSISRDVAAQLINMKYAIQYALPLKNEVVEVLQAYIDANKVEKTDIWKARSVEFSAEDNLKPVLIGIWDTGVDTEVFEGRLYINEGEKINGKDDDNNGFIDDVYGIAYTLIEDKTPYLMYPIDPADAKRLPDMMNQIKGLEDLQAAIESSEASELKKKMSSLKPDEVKPFIEEINLFGIYAHGTHVAGIAVEGNPYAKILVARITADHRMIPEPPTIELAKKASESYREVVDYFQKNNVRVVNMSWGLTVKEIELTLEANGIGKDAEERSKLTREIFDIYRGGLHNALKSAPDILFVIAAGNIDSDVEFDEVIPSSFDLPNVLTVGAVDQAGEETSFTSFGESVDVHANGFEVESYVPGGSRMAFSGTSMSAPNVANLAGKLLALDPFLTVSEVIDLIKKGSDISENGRLVLINPKKSVELLKGENKVR